MPINKPLTTVAAMLPSVIASEARQSIFPPLVTQPAYRDFPAGKPK